MRPNDARRRRGLTLQTMMFAVALIAVSLVPVVTFIRWTGPDELIKLVLFELIVPPLAVLFWVRRTARNREERRRSMGVFWVVMSVFYTSILVYLFVTRVV